MSDSDARNLSNVSLEYYLEKKKIGICMRTSIGIFIVLDKNLLKNIKDIFLDCFFDNTLSQGIFISFQTSFQVRIKLFPILFGF